VKSPRRGEAAGANAWQGPNKDQIAAWRAMACDGEDLLRWNRRRGGAAAPGWAHLDPAPGTLGPSLQRRSQAQAGRRARRGPWPWRAGAFARLGPRRREGRAVPRRNHKANAKGAASEAGGLNIEGRAAPGGFMRQAMPPEFSPAADAAGAVHL